MVPQVIIMPACQPGYRRLQVCIRDDLYRAIVLIEASERLKRYKIIEDALVAYLGSGRRGVGRYRVVLVSEDVYNELARLGGGDVEGGLKLLLAGGRGLDPAIVNRVVELFGSVESALRLLLAAYEVVNKQHQLGEARQKMQEQAQAEGVEPDFLVDNPWVSIIRSKARSN